MTSARQKESLAYSPDGRLLAGTGEDITQIDLWNTRTGERWARLAGHTGAVCGVAFSATGPLLASASSDRTVRLWDVAAAKCVAVLTGHTDQVYSAAFHPDGKRLASAGRDRAIWLGTWRPAWTWPGWTVTQTTSSPWPLARMARPSPRVPATAR